MKHHHRPGKKSLQRRLFVWFGLTILLTGVVFGAIAFSTWGKSWKKEMEGAQRFVSGRFALVWDDPVQRDELARSLTRDFDVDVRLFDARGAPLAGYGSCSKYSWRLPVVRDGQPLGSVQVCADRHNPWSFARVALGLVVACFVLWGMSGMIARRLTRPITELAKVAEDIGAGDLQRRVKPHWRHGEAFILAEALNRMAESIEEKMKEQRALLAAVSHEIRTPLSRIRLLLELSRENGVVDPSLAEIDREVVEMDRLVAELLASSRLDFKALSPTKLDAEATARRALERAGMDPALLVVDGGATLTADPTLLARALANLIDNARDHGGGLTALRVLQKGDRLQMVAEDDGPGFPPGEEEKVFAPFYRSGDAPPDRPSLGLGLALVRRIAEAHGGRAYAENRSPRGARVVLELPMD